MVTFRFYLVSIVAFFLALSVGVVLGSVLDDGISNSLKDRLESVETNLNDTVGAMDQKNRDIANHEKFESEAEQFLVEGRLKETTTLVVAESGLQAEPVQELVDQLRVAGSNTPGIVWVDKSWTPTSEKFLARVATALGVDSVPHRKAAATLWTAVLDDLQGESASGHGGTTTTSTPTTTAAPGGTAVATQPVDIVNSALLATLSEQSILKFQLVDGDNPTGGGVLNIVLITGADSALNEPGSAVAALASVSGTREVPTVLAEQRANDDKTTDNRGELINKAADERVRSSISTVDDIDIVPGRVATVLALQQFKDGKTGSYGFGKGADSVLPKWPGL